MPLTPRPAAPPLLFLSPRVPWPLNTGAKIRTHALLAALCESFEVHYAGFLQHDLTDAEARRRLSLCQTVRLEPEPGRTGAGKAWLLGRSLTDARPVTILKYDHSALRHYVSLWMQENPGGLVHADHLHMACYLDCGRPRARVIDAHNVECTLLERMAETYYLTWLRPWLRGQARRMARYEALAVAGADQTLAVSTADAERLTAMAPGARLHVITNGVDLRYFRAPPRGHRRIAGRLVFTGSMDWLPNEDGIRWFLDEVWPLLPAGEGQPPWQLDVVGRSPTAGLRARARRNIRITGAVPDVRPFLHEAEVAIVPLRIGGGSRLKILEAFAAGLPVVSTRLGCEGLDVEDGRHLLVADGPEAFAGAIARLHADAALRTRLAEAAASWVAHGYDWQTIGTRLVAHYRDMISGELPDTAKSTAQRAQRTVG